MPVFTGAELALADALILIMKVMAMHGVIDGEAIDTVFSDMENRYRGQKLDAAAAMADICATHAIGSDRGRDADARCARDRPVAGRFGLNHKRVSGD